MKTYFLGLLLLFCTALQAEAPKLLVLVIASDNHPLYKEFEKLWTSYIFLHENVDVYFLKGDPEMDTECCLEGRVFKTKIEDTYQPGILYKTLSALEFFKNDQYDYILRTNLSSFFDFCKLFSFLEKLPKERCYAGKPVLHEDHKHPCYHNSVLASGAGFVLSPDVAALLVEEKETLLSAALEAPDDVLISYCLKKKGVPITGANQYYFVYLKEWQAAKHRLPPDAYHFRVRNYRAGCLPGFFRDLSSSYCEELSIATDIVKTIYPSAVVSPNYDSEYPLTIPLSAVYKYFSALPCPYSGYFPLLRKLARSSSSVIEVGQKNMEATWALLLGLSESEKEERSYYGYFSHKPTAENLLLAKKLSSENGVDFSFTERHLPLAKTDLAVLDSERPEDLEKLSPWVEQRIALCLRPESQEKMRAALEAFLEKHPEWMKEFDEKRMVVLQKNVV